MSKVAIEGNASGTGTFTIASPNSNTNRTLSIPDATTTLVGTDATQTLTNKTLGSGLVMGASAVTSATAQASTSGTSIDFTSIPSWVKRITVMLSGVSTSGSSPIIIRIGDSGGISATGYTAGYAEAINLSNTQGANPTTGFQLHSGNASTRETEAGVTITNVNSNLWLAFGVSTFSDYPSGTVLGGSKLLSATLDRVRITTLGGTDTFDAGTINILYE